MLLFRSCVGQADMESPLIAVPEVLHEVLNPATDEFVVLACDGVWDVMTGQQVVNFVRRRLLETSGDPEQVAEDLCLKALQLNSIDNVTALVVRLPNM
jgi:serine/threonine protein phosphatase PrpC